MALASRTVNPLHFEDLEPHQFEDLARQLVYDFKDWRQLEATGRAGSDDGFDVRGWEIAAEASDDRDSTEDESLEELRPVQNDRLWLVQCKREKVITPKKCAEYLDQIPEAERKNLFGIIFIATADFSKKSRDVFRAKCSEFGLSEYHIWGKAELEDFLFQPKYDHLLFAYFGISLVVRRRSIKTQLRARLAMKRKAYRVFGQHGERHHVALVRDPEEQRFPYRDEIPDFDMKPRWRVYQVTGQRFDGMTFLVRDFFAYVADDGVHWDMVDKIDDSRPHFMEDPWCDRKKNEQERDLRDRIWHFWQDIPDRNRAHYRVAVVLPYERILDIDEIGDSIFEHPHVFASWDDVKMGPFAKYNLITVETSGLDHQSIDPQDENRIKFFPETFPDLESTTETFPDD